MEGIFEALLQFIVELVLEIAGEAVGEIAEQVISNLNLSILNFKMPTTNSCCNEIISLDILNQNKENLHK